MPHQLGRGIDRALTRRALLGGDTENVAQQRIKKAHLIGRQAMWPHLRKAPSRSIGYFQPIHAAAPLTARTESSKSDYLAPQTGFELMTFWLTVIVLDYTDSPERRTGEQVTLCPEVLHLRLLPDAAIRSVVRAPESLRFPPCEPVLGDGKAGSRSVAFPRRAARETVRPGRRWLRR